MANNIFPDEEEIMSRLYIARRQDKISADRIVFKAAKRVARKLNKLIEDGQDTNTFLIAIILAGFKDCVDLGLNLFLIGLFPIIGQLLGLFISATLMYFLWGKGWFNTTKIKIIWWVFGLIFDNLPLLNTMPMTVFTVLMAWHVVRKKARKAKENLEKLNEKTIEELEKIEKETEIEDIE